MIDSLKLDELSSVLCRWPSAPAILLADGMRFLAKREREREDVITNLLEFRFHFRDVFFRARRLLLVVLLSLLCAQIVPLCQQLKLQTGPPSEP